MILGLPTGMLVVFVLTLLGGSVGAIHYLTVHVLLGKSVARTIGDRYPPAHDQPCRRSGLL